MYSGDKALIHISQRKESTYSTSGTVREIYSNICHTAPHLLDLSQGTSEGGEDNFYIFKIPS
jgi:hypothetical protein